MRLATAPATQTEVFDEMCRRPARTLEGLAFKARVALEHEDDLYAELVTSIMDDILAIGGSACVRPPSSPAARPPRSRSPRCSGRLAAERAHYATSATR